MANTYSNNKNQVNKKRKVLKIIGMIVLIIVIILAGVAVGGFSYINDKLGKIQHEDLTPDEIENYQNIEILLF